MYLQVGGNTQFNEVNLRDNRRDGQFGEDMARIGEVIS